jgi:hypothetical protein
MLGDLGLLELGGWLAGVKRFYLELSFDARWVVLEDQFNDSPRDTN